MDKNLFATQRGKLVPPTDTVNHAGGRAYSRTPEEALAQYAATGMFGDTYYANAEEQLTEVLKLAEKCSTQYILKCAVYARQAGWLKDMPAVLLAVASARLKFDPSLPVHLADRTAFANAFRIIIDNGKMLRNFFQVSRSGVTGRKSLPHVARRLVRGWLNKRRSDQLMRDQVGESPSLADVIKALHPKPVHDEQRAMFGYLTGPVSKKTKAGELKQRYDPEKLYGLVKQYEAFKLAEVAERGDVPHVDFRLLDSLKLTSSEWKTVFQHAEWQFTRMNLNTALRHGVLKDPEMAGLIAERLRSPSEVRASRNFPYQLLQAWRHVENDMPMEIKLALQDAMEVATENVPEMPGNTFIALDTSGSMQSEFMKRRDGKPTQLSALDVAALFAAVLMRKNPRAILLPFNDKLYPHHKLNPRDSITTLIDNIKRMPSGGTDCSLPLLWMNGINDKRQAITNIDTVIYLSDYESWADNLQYQRQPGTGVMQQWQRLKTRNPRAKLICIDMTPRKDAQATNGEDRLNIGGFNDGVFKVVAEFMKTGKGSAFVDKIEALDLTVASNVAS
jgi:60 kDa SS-A/Ro ribonucleoprotein